MLNEIRSPCWKIATQESAKGEESGIGFCCVGLRGPPTLWYTHWSSASSRMSCCRQHTSTSWEDFVSICVHCVQKGLISHCGDSLTINDIRLVGVQQFKSLCANDAQDFCFQYIYCLSGTWDGFPQSEGRKEQVYLWVTRWIYVAHEGIKPIVAAIFIFCSIMWRAAWPRLAMPMFIFQTRQIIIFLGHSRQQQPCLHWLTNQNQF